MITSTEQYLRLKNVSIDNRDFEPDYKNPNFKLYEFNLSHCRAISRVSSTTDKQYFQGSSLLRKKIIQDKTQSVQSGKEIAFKEIFEISKREHDSALCKVKNLSKRKYMEDNTMSRRTKIKIKEKIFSLYAANPKIITFVTLTMIDKCTDRVGVKILNKFLTALRQIKGSFNYIWVAERQQNGNIHFHCIMNKRFDVEYINSLWVMQQFNAGLDNTEARIKLELKEGKTFKQLHNMGKIGQRITQKYLNPVDVKKVNSITKLSSYLTEYVTKNEQKFTCRVWHCSRGISRLFTKQIISKRLFDLTSSKKNSYRAKNGNIYVVKTFYHQYGLINTILNKKYFNNYLKEMNLLNSWILNGDDIKEGAKLSEQRFRDILYSYNDSKNKIKTKSISGRQTLMEILHSHKLNKN